jgi:hypothetical protein
VARPILPSGTLQSSREGIMLINLATKRLGNSQAQ